MKRAMLIVCAIGLIMAMYGLADAIDRHGDARAELAAAVQRDCLPRPGETAIIISDGRRTECRLYTTRSTSPGMARQLVSASALEVQP